MALDWLRSIADVPVEHPRHARHEGRLDHLSVLQQAERVAGREGNGAVAMNHE
jgi:hypothetical protein